MQFLFDLDSKGYLKRRESAILEYKQNFQKGDNLLKYLKTAQFKTSVESHPSQR